MIHCFILIIYTHINIHRCIKTYNYHYIFNISFNSHRWNRHNNNNNSYNNNNNNSYNNNKSYIGSEKTVLVNIVSKSD